MGLTLALTGGTGFVGRHTLHAALAAGHRVRALARRPQPELAGCTWVAGDLADRAALRRLVEGTDAVIHVAGVTNAADAAGFLAANVAGTRAMREAAAGLPFVHVSSLAAREPALSIYGDSKRQAEDAVTAAAGRFAIVRPPAVYGPGDTELLPMFRALRLGAIALPRGTRASMIHVGDLGRALVALAADLAGPGRAAGGRFEIDDGSGGYPQAAIARAAAAAVGRRALVVEVPGGWLGAAAGAATLLAGFRGQLPKLSRDRARYLAHPDWTADCAPLLGLGLWQPGIGLQEGMAATVAWYRASGWL